MLRLSLARVERCKIESGGQGNGLTNAFERLRDIMRQSQDAGVARLMVAYRFQFACCQLDCLSRCLPGRIRCALNDLLQILDCGDGLVGNDYQAAWPASASIGTISQV